jgi:bla regulator protein BlaR1
MKTRRVSVRFLLVSVGLATLTHAQPAPKFEVASVKLYQDDGVSPRNLHNSYGPQGIDFRETLAFIIADAYNTPLGRIQGPGSLTKEALWAPLRVGYDIVAKADHPVPKDQLRLMLQSLLADRFKLTLHWEARTGSVYRLVVAKGGPKLEESDAAGVFFFDARDGWVFRNAGMVQLSSALAGHVDRVVVDQTGLKGLYNFVLKMPTYEGQDLAAVKRLDGLSPETPSASDFADALRQLGLQLIPDRAPVDYLVIDSVEKPSEN